MFVLLRCGASFLGPGMAFLGPLVEATWNMLRRREAKVLQLNHLGLKNSRPHFISLSTKSRLLSSKLAALHTTAQSRVSDSRI